MEPLRELPHLELQINTRFNKTHLGGVGDDYWKGTYRKGRLSRQSKAPSRIRMDTKKEAYPSKVQRYVVTGVSMNVSKKDEPDFERRLEQSIQRHNSRATTRLSNKAISRRRSDYSSVNQNQVKTHLDSVMPSNTALIKCSLLNAIETGNFISSPVIDTTIKPRRSKSEIKQRSSLDPSLHRRSMSRANHYKETRTQRTSLGSNYRSYHDTEHNQIIPKQFTRDEKVRNWIEYTSFTSAYAINDTSHAWSNKI